MRQQQRKLHHVDIPIFFHIFFLGTLHAHFGAAIHLTKEHIMGIFTRFKDIVTSNISNMLDSAEDPDKLIRLMLREMEETLVELKAGCAATMAEASHARHQLEDAEKTAALWNHRAVLAVQANRDDMAREAVDEALQAQERVDDLAREAQAFDDLIVQGRDDIKMLEERIVSTRNKQRLMSERHTQARTRRQARQKARAADALDTMERFEDLEQRITRMEHEAELEYVPPVDKKHADFKTLEREAAITAALDELKRRLDEQTPAS
jgi:phage shock protein A